MKKDIASYIVVGLASCVLVGMFLFTLFSTAPWYVGHDNGEAYNAYEASMLENGMHPDVYGYGWSEE